MACPAVVAKMRPTTDNRCRATHDVGLATCNGRRTRMERTTRKTHHCATRRTALRCAFALLCANPASVCTRSLGDSYVHQCGRARCAAHVLAREAEGASRLRGCVLRAACCVLRAACCVPHVRQTTQKTLISTWIADLYLTKLGEHQALAPVRPPRLGAAPAHGSPHRAPCSTSLPLLRGSACGRRLAAQHTMLQHAHHVAPCCNMRTLQRSAAMARQGLRQQSREMYSAVLSDFQEVRTVSRPRRARTKAASHTHAASSTHRSRITRQGRGEHAVNPR